MPSEEDALFTFNSSVLPSCSGRCAVAGRAVYCGYECAVTNVLCFNASCYSTYVTQRLVMVIVWDLGGLGVGEISKSY